MNSLSIVIPAHNEAGRIEESVRDAIAVGAELAPALEVLICNDGSTDETGEILEGLARADRRVRVLHRHQNRGIEASMRALYLAASSEHIFLNSADGQWPMSALVDMALALAEGADLVVGVRRDKRSVYTPYRRAVSFAYERAVMMLGATVGDPGSIKLGRAEVFRLPLVSVGVFAEGERVIRAARNGYRVREVPVEFRPRRSGRARGARAEVVARAALDAIRVAGSLSIGWPRPGQQESDLEVAG